MGGACRESYRVTVNRRWVRPSRLYRALRWNWRLILEDNLAWIVCGIFGHKAYSTSTIYEPPEHACSHCHQWLTHLDPKPGEWHPPPGAPHWADQSLNKPLLLQTQRRRTE